MYLTAIHAKKELLHSTVALLEAQAFVAIIPDNQILHSTVALLEDYIY